jgi:hyperosmotically inducible periplasmic protein
MMNSNSTHKIVVGIGLAVVFGVGVSVFAVRAKQESDLARTAPAPAQAAPTDQNAADQNATDATAPAQSPAAQTPSDQTATAPGAQPSAPPAAAPQNAHSGQISDEFSPAKWDRAASVAKASNSAGSARTRVASAAETQQSPAEPVASDTQITDTVKSEVATAAPISDLNVTTINGVVALAGSVPSEDAVDQARQAALRVAGVKQVDASGLTVSDR